MPPWFILVFTVEFEAGPSLQHFFNEWLPVRVVCMWQQWLDVQCPSCCPATGQENRAGISFDSALSVDRVHDLSAWRQGGHRIVDRLLHVNFAF